MAVAAAATILGSLISSTVPTILSLIVEKIKDQKKASELQSLVHSITRELEFIQAAIEDNRVEGKDTTQVRKVWIEQLRRLGHKIQDCIDDFTCKLRLGEMKTDEFVGKMKALQEDAVDIHKMHDSYSKGKLVQPREGAASSSSSREDELIPRAADDPILIQELLKLLETSEDVVGRNVKVISINGVVDIDNRAEVLLSEIHRRLGDNRCFVVTDDIPKSMQWKLVNSPDLHDCLLYFCMFPHFCMFPTGHRVSKSSLKRRWLAEGLVPDEFDKGKSQHCQPDGTVHRYISEVSRLGKLVSCRDGTPGREAKHVRRLSLHDYCGGAISPLGSMCNLSGLHTLAIFPQKDGRDGRDAVEVEFSKYKWLRVLDLGECDGLHDSHLKKICGQLMLLEYLSLGGTISKVPMKIKKMESLETLDLRRSSAKMAVKVPAEVIMLPKLKHLLGKFSLFEGYASWPTMTNLKMHLKKRGSNLQTLAGFVFEKSGGFPELMIHMNQLRKIKIWCKSTADSKKQLRHLSAAIKEFGTNTRNDRSLSIDVSECERSKQVLDDLNKQVRDSMMDPGPLVALDSLKLSGRLSEFPQFVTALAGNITQLCLFWTNLSWDLILGDETKSSALENLDKLKFLKLVEQNPCGQVVLKPNIRGRLKRICLVGEENLPQITIQKGALPFLASLLLLCKDLAGLSGINIKHLGELEEVALHYGVSQETKEIWKHEVTRHSKSPSPRVVFIESPQKSAASRY